MLIKYILLGIIQGITEPIPVSSSGHIIIFKNIFNIKINDINFEIIINFASFLAILFLYRKKITRLIKNFFSYIIKNKYDNKDDFNYVILIIISTIPVCIIGFLLKDTIDKLSNNIKLISIALLITSFSLYLIKDKDGYKTKKDISKKDALIIGIYQIFALFPGISRSGTTIFGSLKNNLNKEEAVNYSFMLYLPVSFASFILGLYDLFNTPNIIRLIPIYIISFIICIATTYISTKWFINIVKRKKLIYFSIYCFLLSIILFLLF